MRGARKILIEIPEHLLVVDVSRGCRHRGQLAVDKFLGHEIDRLGDLARARGQAELLPPRQETIDMEESAAVVERALHHEMLFGSCAMADRARPRLILAVVAERHRLTAVLVARELSDATWVEAAQARTVAAEQRLI